MNKIINIYIEIIIVVVVVVNLNQKNDVFMCKYNIIVGPFSRAKSIKHRIASLTAKQCHANDIEEQ